MKKEKTVRTYQRRTKSGKMVTVHEHKASYDAAEEARKAAAKKAGAGSELSKKKAVKEESPLGFSADDYKAWYHWDMEDDANNEAALRVEKALTKKMGKKAYNKYLEDMSNSYSARGHKKAHQSLLDEHTARQKKQDAEISAAAKDIARGAKEKAAESKASKTSKSKKSATSTSDSVEAKYKAGKKLTDDDLMSWATENNYEGFEGSKSPKMTAKHRKEITNYIHGATSGNEYYGNGQWEKATSGKSSAKTEKAEPKTKKLTAKDYQSMSDEELQKHHDNYRYKTNSSLSRSEQYHKKTIAAEVTRRSEEKAKAEEKSARKAVGGLVSGNTWRYNSSDGSFSTSHSTAWGRPDSSRVEKLIQKAKDAGWKKADHSSSMQPDDKGYRSTERYVSPDGKHELTYHYSAGDFSRNNHYVTISRTKSEETPTQKVKKAMTALDDKTKARRIAASSFGEKEYKSGGKAGQAALDEFLGTMKPNAKGQYYVSFGDKNVKNRGTKWMSRADIERYIRGFGGTTFGSARITAAEPKKKK